VCVDAYVCVFVSGVMVHGAMGQRMGVAPVCRCYVTRQTDISCKTYYVDVTNVEYLTRLGYKLMSS